MFRKKSPILPAALFFSAGTLSVFSAGTPSAETANALPAIDEPAQAEYALYSSSQSMRIVSRLTAFFLERAHITRKKIAALDMNELIKTDCNDLDGSKMFFLQSDIDAFCARFSPTLSDYLARGNLHAAFTLYKKFSERVGERVAWIDERLQHPENFQLDRTDSIKINRKDEGWPAPQEVADLLLEQRLTFELVSQIFIRKEKNAVPAESASDDENADVDSGEAAGATDADAVAAFPSSEEIAAACEKLRTSYGSLRANLTLEPWEIEEIFLNALCKLYDPHTSFFSKQTMEEFEIMMRNSLCGIGAVLTMDDGYCTVREIMPGSPAERSGKISTGDRIVAIQDARATEMTNVVNMRLNRIVRMLRGKKGVPVRLLVESGADHATRSVVELVRDEVKLTEQLAAAKIIDVPAPSGEATVPVGVIQLPSFYGKDRSAAVSFSTAEDVKELLGKLKKSNVRAIVLDLRNNGGGYLNEAIDLVELFVGPGIPALQTKDSEGKISTLRTSGAIGVVKNIFSSTPEWTGPVVVLVSKLSASASEIVAGALQDNHRAPSIGDPITHGKGSVQEVIPFRQYDSSQDASIKLTRSKWYAPSGNSIQIRGVAADIAIPSVYSVLPVGEGDLDRPLPWDSIPTALDDSVDVPAWAKAPISQELIDLLAKNSRARQVELPEFLTHSRVVSWRAEREKDKTYPLGLVARSTMKDEDKAFADWVKKEYTQLAETSAFPQKEIKLDSAIAQEKNSEEGTKRIGSTLKTGSLTGLPTRKQSATDSDVDEEDDWPDFDVLLRESVRVAADWVSLLDNGANSVPAAKSLSAASAPEKK